MAIPEKAREKLDDASREIKDAINGLKRQVAELNEKVKNKLSSAAIIIMALELEVSLFR